MLLWSLLAALVFLALSFVSGASAADFPVLTFRKAWKCRRKSPDWNDVNGRAASETWNEKIVSPPEDIRFDRDTAKGPGCYKIRMKILLKDPVKEPFQLRLWVRVGSAKGQPLPCSRTEKEKARCKGGIGSCIYCSLCGDLNKQYIEIDGVNQSLRCPLQRNWHTIAYSLCLPDNDELQKIVPDDIQKLIEITDGSESKQDLFIRLELYDSDVGKQCGSYYKPQDCPANAQVAKQMIGCMSMYASIKAKFKKTAGNGEIHSVDIPKPRHST